MQNAINEFINAIRQKDVLKAKKLVESGELDVNAKECIQQDSLLTLACSIEAKELVKFLINKGAEVDAKNSDGVTPLMRTAAIGNIEILKLLLENGANINEVNLEGSTALIPAIKYNHLVAVEFLVEWGVNLNSAEINPLTSAVQYNRYYLTKILLDKGADVNFVNKDGSTPLMLACQNGNEKIVGLLLDYNADINIKNKKKDALGIAKKNKYSNIVELIKNRNEVCLEKNQKRDSTKSNENKNNFTGIGEDSDKKLKIIYAINHEMIQRNLILLLENQNVNIDYDEIRDTTYTREDLIQNVIYNINTNDVKYDVAVISEKLPGENDFIEVIRFLKGNNIRPVIMLGSKDDEDPMLKQLKNMGAYDVLYNKLKVDDIIKLILIPNEYENVSTSLDNIFENCEIQDKEISNDSTSYEIEQSIKNIIASEELKSELLDIVKYLKFSKHNSDNGIIIPKIHLNMVFAGNQATGKHLVAKIMAKTLYKYGYLISDNLIEVTAADLQMSHVQRALGGVLLITEFDKLLISIDELTTRRGIPIAFNDIINKYVGKLCVILTGEGGKIQRILSQNPDLERIFTKTLLFPDLKPEGIMQIFESQCSKYGYIIDDEFKEKIFSYIRSTHKSSNYKNGMYAIKLFEEIVMNNSINNCGKENYIKQLAVDDIPNNSEIITLDDIEKELENLVGMEKLKNQVKDLMYYLQYNEKMKQFGANKIKVNLHMLFTGEPGTGKTTVARIIAKILYTLGYVGKNKLVEVECKDLIAACSGQSAIKTNQVIQSAMDGVLFIDEAYSLKTGPTHQGSNYGMEAIAVLIKAMEDYKDRLVVIFAGYKKEMEDFVNINPGIKSRIGYIIDFERYISEELVQMFKNLCSQNGYIIDNEAIEKVAEITDEALSIENFGNGRFVGNLFQRVIIRHAVNSRNVSDEEELRTIHKEDITDEILQELEGEKDKKDKIGFVLDN